jgi:actin-like ATPase involved in cell morphogenesis
MSYQLGIDLGTTYTAAAVCRASGGAEVVGLGSRSATVASVLYLAGDGSVVVGEAAERRALTDPDRVVREFKRRIGDQIPLLIGGREYSAQELAARLARWVVDAVSAREGGPPRRVGLTHPAAWGAHKKELLASALAEVGLGVSFLAEPRAAAVAYARAERVDPGSTVAVYDLGGGTFDAAVVRKSAAGGFELLGRPEGIERLGGVDFDEAVFAHVRQAVGPALDGLDPEDPDVLAAVARLRRECVEAKEALSADTEVTIPVLLPSVRTQVRLVRAEFEAMIRPAVEQTIEALRRAVGSAGLAPADLSAVLLVGGSSRIPLVAQLVSAELGRPVAVDADPKTAIATGAALAISPSPAAATSDRPAPTAAAAGAAGRTVNAPHRHPPPPVPARNPLPRPTVAPPPRPEQRMPPAAFGPEYGAEGYYSNRGTGGQTGMMIGIGGVLIVAAILALVYFWPSSANDTTTGTGGDLTSASTAPTTTSPAPPTTRHRVPRTTARQAPPPPATTTHDFTSTVTIPPSSATSEPSPTPSTSPPTSTSGDGAGDNANNGGDTGQRGGGFSSTPNAAGSSGGTSDAGAGGGTGQAPSGTGVVREPGVPGDAGAPRDTAVQPTGQAQPRGWPPTPAIAQPRADPGSQRVTAPDTGLPAPG